MVCRNFLKIVWLIIFSITICPLSVFGWNYTCFFLFVKRKMLIILKVEIFWRDKPCIKKWAAAKFGTFAGIKLFWERVCVFIFKIFLLYADTVRGLKYIKILKSFPLEPDPRGNSRRICASALFFVFPVLLLRDNGNNFVAVRQRLSLQAKYEPYR